MNSILRIILLAYNLYPSRDVAIRPRRRLLANTVINKLTLPRIAAISPAGPALLIIDNDADRC